MTGPPAGLRPGVQSFPMISMSEGLGDHALTGVGSQGPAVDFYDSKQLAGLPEPVQTWAPGVGNPLPHAGLQEGETVLDLGSGSGIDLIELMRELAPPERHGELAMSVTVTADNP